MSLLIIVHHTGYGRIRVCQMSLVGPLSWGSFSGGSYGGYDTKEVAATVAMVLLYWQFW